MNTPLKTQINCNNCGGAVQRELFASGVAQQHRIVQCGACGLMYASPLHAPALEQYIADDDAEVRPLTAQSPEVRRAEAKVVDYLPIEPVLRGLLPKGGRLVEVGAYAGQLLAAFRDLGWRTLGIEPDGRAVRYARETYQLEMVEGTLTAAELAPASVDAMLLIHVIEHVEDPAVLVGEIATALRCGGVFVVETPTYDSLAFRLLGRRERNLGCEGHIFFYTEPTLCALLAKSGFAIERVERVGRTMSIAQFMRNLAKISRSGAVSRIVERGTEALGLDRRLLHLNARDMIRIYARKPVAGDV